MGGPSATCPYRSASRIGVWSIGRHTRAADAAHRAQACQQAHTFLTRTVPGRESGAVGAGTGWEMRGSGGGECETAVERKGNFQRGVIKVRPATVGMVEGNGRGCIAKGSAARCSPAGRCPAPPCSPRAVLPPARNGGLPSAYACFTLVTWMQEGEAPSLATSSPPAACATRACAARRLKLDITPVFRWSADAPDLRVQGFRVLHRLSTATCVSFVFLPRPASPPLSSWKHPGLDAFEEDQIENVWLEPFYSVFCWAFEPFDPILHCPRQEMAQKHPRFDAFQNSASK